MGQVAVGILADNGGGIVGILMMLIYLALIVAVAAGMWKTFEKAGRQGWEGIVPFYNMYVLTQIVGRPWWWFLLTLVPCVGIVIWILLAIDTAKSYGQSQGFGIGLALLPF